MALKVVMYFAQDKGGWSEINYNSATDLSAFVPADDVWTKGSSPAVQLFLLRREFLVDSAKIVHMRISQTDSPGVFITHDYDGNQGKGKWGTGNIDSETETFASLTVTLRAGGAGRRRIYLAGLPESVIDPPNTYKASAGWKRTINPYLQFISTGTWVVRSRPRAGPANVTQLLSFDVDASGRNAVALPIVRPAGTPNSWYVIIRGLNAPAGWNGVHKAALSAGGGTMILGPTRRPLPAGPPFVVGSRATAAVMTPAYLQLTAYDTGRIVERKRGRPFGQSRGRR